MNRQKHSDDLFPSTNKKRIVIVGGGFGGITLVKKLKKSDFQIILIDRNNYHTFQPLLYQVATGGLEPDSIAYPIRKIFRGYSNVFFRVAMLEQINLDSNQIQTSIGNISYDYLVLAAGSTNNYFGLNELAEKSMPMKTLTDALDLRSLILQNIEQSLSETDNKAPLLNFVIAGGGPTGVETAGALCELKKHVLPSDYPELDFNKMRIILAEAGNMLLKGMSEHASVKTENSLKKLGVEVKLNCAVTSYDGNLVILANGETIPCSTFIWSAGVRGHTFKGIENAYTARANRIKVDRFNKMQGSKNVFAIGDIAFMEEEKYPFGHPMVAQTAIQQAENLAYNLTAKQKSSGLKPFKYKDLGSLATIGRNKAVADFKSIKLSGVPAWWIWMAVHLMTLVGYRNRLIVFINWVWSYFSYDRAIRLIIRPFTKK